MNDLQIFTYQDKPLRTVEKDGELWWVLKDVCDVLGIAKARAVADRLDPDEAALTGVIDNAGREQPTYIINEPGLYSVILRSDKPEAKDFKRWVTHEVLPSIRRTGSYAMAPARPMTPAQLLAAQAQVLVDMERRMDAMQGQARALEAKVDTALKVFARPAEDHWKADMDAAIKTLCQDRRLSITATKGRMYDELERTANCQVNARLLNLRRRMKNAGMRHRDTMALTKLDAIAADKQLRAIFEGVVRKWQALPAPGDDIPSRPYKNRAGDFPGPLSHE